MARFYNPGFAWNETLKFDNPVSDSQSSNISFHPINAGNKSFFEVAEMQVVILPTGEAMEVPLRFKELVRLQYADKGVVLVVPGRTCTELENIAENDVDAKRKGTAVWKQYMMDRCNEWFRLVEEIKAQGRLPRPAEGLFKRCLLECGIADPADYATVLSKAKEDQQENKDMQKQISDLTALVNRLLVEKTEKKVA